MNRKIRLVKLPGIGPELVDIEQGTTTWAQLVEKHKLFDRQIIAMGVGVPTEKYGELIGAEVKDVFATAAVKGN